MTVSRHTEVEMKKCIFCRNAYQAPVLIWGSLTDMHTPAECDTLPSDDFCLMLNSFDVNEQSKTDAHRLDRGEETDEISNDDGAVPEMPAFPSDLVSCYQAAFL